MADYADLVLNGPSEPQRPAGATDYASMVLGTPSAPKNTQAKIDPPSALARYGRGFADYTQGAEQLRRQITGDDPEGYTADKSAELALYERGRGEDAGIDWMRILGNATVTAPTMAIPGALSSSMRARALSGAASGALGSGAQFVEEGGSRIPRTLFGAGVGAAVGAVAPHAIDYAKRIVTSAWEKVFGRTPSQAATSAVQNAMSQAGIPSHSSQVQSVNSAAPANLFGDLVAEVDDAMRQGVQFTPEQLSRLVEMRAVGANPMKANITKTPEDWATMENLRGMPKTGAPINNRIVENANALVRYTEGLRDQMGGKAPTAYAAGSSVLDAVQSKWAETQARVGRLYEGVRKKVGDNVGFAPGKMLSVLDEVSDDAAADPLVASVRRRMTRLGLLDKDGAVTGNTLSISKAEELRKWIGGLSDGGERSVKRLKSMVIDALDDDVIDTAGIDSFKAARDAARKRFTEFEKGSLDKAVADKLSPDDFVQKHVIGAKVDDLKALKDTLTSGTKGQKARGSAAWDDARGWVITDMLMKATGARTPEDIGRLPFSGNAWKRALSSLPPEKKAILFTAEEMRSLRTLTSAATNLTETVPGSAANYSRSGSVVVEYLSNTLSKIPLLASIIGMSPKGMVASAAVSAGGKAAANAKGAAALSQQLGGLPTAGPKVLVPPAPLAVLPAAAASGAQDYGRR